MKTIVKMSDNHDRYYLRYLFRRNRFQMTQGGHGWNIYRKNTFRSPLPLKMDKIVRMIPLAENHEAHFKSFSLFFILKIRNVPTYDILKIFEKSVISWRVISWHPRVV